MGSEKEKEEIIELTEVIEEGSAFPARKERPERLSPDPEERDPFARSPAAKDSRPGDQGMMKEIFTREAQTWLANNGTQILETIAREIFPQVAEKVLREEIEKLKEESQASEKE